MQLIADGKVDASKLSTHCFQFTEAMNAFETFNRRPSRTLSKFIIGEYLHDPTSRGESRRRTRNIFNKRQRLLYSHYAGKMRAGMKWTVFWITIRLLLAINIVSLGTTRSTSGWAGRCSSYQ